MRLFDTSEVCFQSGGAISFIDCRSNAKTLQERPLLQ